MTEQNCHNCQENDPGHKAGKWTIAVADRDKFLGVNGKDRIPDKFLGVNGKDRFL